MMKQVKFQNAIRTATLSAGLFLSASAFAQQITVKGHVVDETGEPVIGASVKVVGGKTGAVTDIDGNFSIAADKKATLEITYIGYEPLKVVAGQDLKIQLKNTSTTLNDVVVIGYGVAKKNDLTGSVTALKPDDKNHGIITSAQDMIQGKIAGVSVNSASGAPGDGAQIRIRGGASLTASNNPLIVIDGMPMDNNDTKGVNNPLSLVNPNDIESFTVLKDASATAIYGSRGSNGVIIITTKKGRSGQKPQVSYNGTVSVSTIAKKLDVMNAKEYVDFIKNYYGEDSSAYQGLGWKEFNEDGTPNYAAGTFDTDWQDEIYRNGISQEHNVSLTGGINKQSWSMPYRVSAGYTGQEGILKGSDYKRVTAGFNINPSLLDKHLNLNINGKYSYSKTVPGGTDAVGAAINMDPTRPVKSNDEKFKNWGGYWQWTEPTSVFDPTFPYQLKDQAPVNPVEKVENYDFYKSAHVLLGNVEADYKIHGFEDLHLHANLAGEYTTGGEYNTNNPQSTYGYYYGGNSENKEKKYNLLATAYAQYTKDFNKANHFDIMAGYEYSHMKYWGNQWSKQMYPNTWEGKNDKGEALAGTVKSFDTSRWRGQTYLVSWYGRANYSLLDRYLLTFTARYDGSSRFADGHRWGFFPSAAFAWRIKEESFLKNVNAISDFKLRLGWGKTGQQDTGKEYYTATYAKSTSLHHLYPIGANNNGLLYRPLAYNDELTWETTTTWNVGIDYGMFNQRLTVNLDAYYRKTTDLLSTTTIAAGQNFDNALLMNAGTLENKGFEVAITGRPIQTKDWFVELSVNAAYNKNEITELAGGRDLMEAGMKVGQDQAITYHKVGKPANSFLVYQQVYDQNGRPIMGCYVDRDGNGTIDENDRYFYKNIIAPWTGGFSFKVSYKNWDLGSNFRASLGNYLYNGYAEGVVNTKEICSAKGYYKNTTKDIAALGWTSYNYPLTDYFVQNGSFLKCDNITLGYNFNNLLKGGNYKGMSGRIYASCSNVFTITKYSGIDPEVNSGLDNSMYPRCRTFLLGLNLNF
ncbi:SusC/RagA family TonB-linked outer membrane protein [Prevotella sp.]|uniref:SusC/RagA family TonB-linked outer membrane protein n=2 Tax=Prevotella sp. TaxID=59823 RepID=UPI0027E22830|nr:TonB-dependent receptor [Prevotella sp.]